MMTKNIKSNLLTYFLFLLVALTGIYLGNNFVLKYQFLESMGVYQCFAFACRSAFFVFADKGQTSKFLAKRGFKLHPVFASCRNWYCFWNPGFTRF